MPTVSSESVVPRGWRWLRSPAALALYMVLLASALGWLQPLELRLLDLRAALTQHAVPTDVVLVEIDERSLKALHSWPWPRRYHAQLLDILHAAGVKDVFYDVDFSSVSTHDDDKELSRAMAAYPRDRLMLPAFIQPRSNLEKGRLVDSIPLPELRKSATLVSVNLHPDNDGHVRRIAAFWRIGNKLVRPAGLRMADVRHYTDAAVQIDYSIQPDSIPRVSFVDVLAGRYDPDIFRNKHIVVGATAIELGDKLTVPVYHTLPGPVVQALAYLTIREGGLSKLPHMANPLISVLIALFMGLVFKRANWYGALIWMSGMIITSFMAALYAYHDLHVIVATAPALTQGGLGYGLFLMARLEQQHIRLIIQSLDLRRKDTLMSSVVNNSIDGILTVSESGEIRSLNPACLRLFNMSEQALIGCNISQLMTDADASINTGTVQGGIIGDDSVTAERQAKRADGSCFPIELSVSRMALDGEILYTVFVRDITERVRQRELLEYQATHDALTGLGNRYLLNRILKEQLSKDYEESVFISLMMLDLDRFKEINDTLGHGVGDQVLVQIAERFVACAKQAMVMARIGGDEFAILLADQPEMHASRQLAEALHEALEQPFVVNGMALEVDASIGIAHYPAQAQDAATLMKHADAAMYEAKRAGEQLSIYETEYTRKNTLRMNISTGLRQAMSESQLTMHYQPKVALIERDAVDFEALLRWNHPQLGFISPEDIIDVAENTGLIWPLTEWTLRRAIHDTQAWRDMGYNVGTAVNLSARLLQDMMLIERITSCIRDCHAEPRWLTLEITESAIMNDPERALKNAMALCEHGIHLSIDDFGTGYSSLSYLRKLPVKELKIDKSFVMEMLNEGNDLLIVKSTIELAHNLGLKVVAEGVENESILQALSDLGCDIAQGYYISRPIPFEKVTEWLEIRAVTSTEPTLEVSWTT